MALQISFKRFLDHIIAKNKEIEFKDFNAVIIQMFNNQISEKVMLSNANKAIFKVNSELF
jgi:hypothetical protein